MHVYRLNTRSKLSIILLIAAAIFVGGVLLVLGITLLLALSALGAVVALGAGLYRRLTGRSLFRRRAVPQRMDSALEVFPPQEHTTVSGQMESTRMEHKLLPDNRSNDLEE